MRNINNLRYADDIILMAEIEEQLKSLLMRVKEEREKFNSQKTKIIAFGPNTSWQKEREKVEAVTDFTFLGSKITVDSDCNHQVKRGMLLERKAMKNLYSVLISTDISLSTSICIVKAIVFPIVMYGGGIWTIKLSTEELMLLNCGVGEDS